MASSPIVDIGDNVNRNNMGSLPEMMFAAGEEPVGVRVLTYQSSRAIKKKSKGLMKKKYSLYGHRLLGR